MKRIKKISKDCYSYLKKILSLFLLAGIRFYRVFLSPLKRYNHCRFTPTCSEYALEAIEKYGPFKGTFLSIKRILRCNPFSKGGYDPVP